MESGELEAARRLVGWHLVSRDTSRLDDSQVAAAAIESLAENANDSIVAPLLFYAIAGLPGVLAYRFINTCDAMLGYRDLKREWLGKCSARVDDLANLVPARLTAALIILAGVPLGGSVPRAVRTWFRDSRATASPNAGHPMSAAAGVLGVELAKCGHYRLGTGERLPAARDIAQGKATGLEYHTSCNVGNIGDQDHYVRTRPIAAPGGSEFNHGIHRNTRKRESESTSPFRVLPGSGPTPAGWGAPS